LQLFFKKDLGVLAQKDQEEDTETTNEIKQLISMNESFFIITQNNDLYGWGWNEHGNFGTGTIKDLHSPVLIASKVERVFGNGAYTMLKQLKC
jgi:alpha-tubulin suppressor-like RCC1 family protein